MTTTTIESSQVTWTVYPLGALNDSYEAYCADGDGFVSVEAEKSGKFVLLDQGDFVASFSSREEALEEAQKYLATEYPSIFEDVRE